MDIMKTQWCEMSPLAGGYHWEFITKEGMYSCRWYEFPGVALTKYYNRGWLETTEMSSPTLMEAQSPRSQCQQGRAPSEASGKDPFQVPPCFWLMGAQVQSPPGTFPVLVFLDPNSLL